MSFVKMTGLILDCGIIDLDSTEEQMWQILAMILARACLPIELFPAGQFSSYCYLQENEWEQSLTRHCTWAFAVPSTRYHPSWFHWHSRKASQTGSVFAQGHTEHLFLVYARPALLPILNEVRTRWIGGMLFVCYIFLWDRQCRKDDFEEQQVDWYLFSINRPISKHLHRIYSNHDEPLKSNQGIELARPLLNI